MNALQKIGYHHKKSEIDYTIAKRINKIFNMAISRFPVDTKIWLFQIEFCKKMVNYQFIIFLFQEFNILINFTFNCICHNKACLNSWIVIFVFVFYVLEMEFKYQSNIHQNVESEKQRTITVDHGC